MPRPLSGENLALCGILLATFVVYLRCVSNEFVFDDVVSVVNNRYLGQWSFLWKSLIYDTRWYMDPSHRPVGREYRPLNNIWLALNFQLFGLDPVGWHFALIALHVIVVLLVYKCARRLTADSSAALAAALLFGILPIHADAVVWPSSVGLLLGAAFELAAFYLLISGNRLRDYLWALVLGLFGIFSHEIAIVFPALVALYGFFLGSPRDGGERDLRGRTRTAVRIAAPFAVEALGYLLVRYLVLGFISNGPFKANSMTTPQVLLTVPSALLSYLLLLVTPWRAGPSHRLMVVTSPLSVRFLPVIAILLALAAGLWLAVRRSPRRELYCFCAGWILVAFAPVMDLHGFPEDRLVQDRYLYMASFGWCLAVADWTITLARRHLRASIPLAVGGTALVALLGFYMWKVQYLWHDDVTLFAQCTSEFPEVTGCHRALGVALFQRGDFTAADRELRQALQLDPHDATALYDVGMIDARLGRTQEAADQVAAALARIPNAPPELYIALARLYDAAGRPERAEQARKHAESMPGGFELAALARIQADLDRGDGVGAEKIARELTAKYPQDARAWMQLGFALLLQSRRDEALSSFDRASRVPLTDDPEVLLKLAQVLHQAGRDREALRQCQHAAETVPGDPQVQALMEDIKRALSAPRQGS